MDNRPPTADRRPLTADEQSMAEHGEETADRGPQTGRHGEVDRRLETGSGHDHGGAPAPASQAFVREMDAGMKKMMNDMHAPGYSGNPDVDFLAMMIPHHEGAVEMARLLLIHGKDPLTRRLAEEIIASQTAEIAAMRERLRILRRGDDTEPGGFPALHGTRGAGPK